MLADLAAALIATISACALGSLSMIGRLKPWPITCPCCTSTAPTGTSPSTAPSAAKASARRMNS
ncbi:hypothetical protein D3C79_1027880 [compost metagenome]